MSNIGTPQDAEKVIDHHRFKFGVKAIWITSDTR